MDDEALLAVCRTTYRRTIDVEGGSEASARETVRIELGRAGFEVAEDSTAGYGSVIAVLGDGRYVQRAATGNWSI